MISYVIVLFMVFKCTTRSSSGYEILRFAAFDLYDSPIEMAEIAPTFGIRLTPLEEVVRHTVQYAANV